VTGEEMVLGKIKKISGNRRVCIFDIGANVGEYTRLILNLFPQSRVFSFEPNQIAYKVLSGIKGKNLKTENIALGSKKEKVNIYSFSKLRNTGLASLNNKAMKGLYGSQVKDKVVTFRVNQETVDDYCRKNKIAGIDFMKIDVEGSELDVLRGAKNMLLKKGIKIIQFEFNEQNVVNRIFLKDFYTVLQNYKLFRVSRFGLIDISTYDAINEIFKYQNILAIQKGLVLRIPII
jgi:FkbM family methyltransferase